MRAGGEHGALRVLRARQREAREGRAAEHLRGAPPRGRGRGRRASGCQRGTESATAVVPLLGQISALTVSFLPPPSMSQRSGLRGLRVHRPPRGGTQRTFAPGPKKQAAARPRAPSPRIDVGSGAHGWTGGQTSGVPCAIHLLATRLLASKGWSSKGVAHSGGRGFQTRSERGVCWQAIKSTTRQNFIAHRKDSGTHPRWMPHLSVRATKNQSLTESLVVCCGSGGHNSARKLTQKSRVEQRGDSSALLDSTQ